jgi:signal peptidase I
MKSPLRIVLEPLAIAIGLALLLRSTVQLYAIPSGSMLPTLNPGDTVVVTPYFAGEPQRGDVIVFRSPGDPNAMLIKRVVGIPGDLVHSRLGRVRIGGHTLAEPYLRSPAEAGEIAAQIVPSGHFFVLGDNRTDSLDSRHWGCVPRELIVGRARIETRLRLHR